MIKPPIGFSFIQPNEFWILHQTLYDLQCLRTSCIDSPPLSTQKRVMHRYLVFNALLPAWTHRLTRNLLRISSRGRKYRKFIYRNIKIMLKYRLHILPMWCYICLEFSPEISHKSQFLWGRGTHYQLIDQNDPTYPAHPIWTFIHWTFPSH